MANLKLADRVKETTTTTGTGTITLLGAVAGYQSFETGIGGGSSTYYCIVGRTTTEWEVGYGTYTTAGTTLSRDSVLSSSNSGSLVSFIAGTKDVFITYAANRAVTGSPGIVENDGVIVNSYTIPSGKNAMSAGPITLFTGCVITVPTGSNWTIV